MEPAVKKRRTAAGRPQPRKAGHRGSGSDAPPAAAPAGPRAAPGGDDEDDFALQLGDYEEDEPVAEAEPQPEAEQPKQIKKKRKQPPAAEAAAQPEPEPEPEPQPEATGAAKPSAKAEKRRAKKQQLQAKRLSAAGWGAAREAAAGICTAPPARQAEWLWGSYAAVTGATFLEREGLDEGVVASLPPGGSLEERVFAYRDGWRETLSAREGEPGAPLVLLLASSAVTANALAKLFPAASKGCRVAKLFAKHFKVEEQQADLKRCVHIAAGTPNRVDKLADLGSLRLDRLQLLLVDVALDAKERCILDVPEVCGDFWQLFRKHIRARAAAGEAKIALIDSAKL